MWETVSAGIQPVNSARRTRRSAQCGPYWWPSRSAPPVWPCHELSKDGRPEPDPRTIASFFAPAWAMLARRTESRHCAGSKISAFRFLQPSFFSLTCSLPAHSPSPTPSSPSHDVLSNENNRHLNFPIRTEDPPVQFAVFIQIYRTGWLSLLLRLAMASLS